MPRFKNVELVNETNMTYPETYDRYFVGNLKRLAFQYIWNANVPAVKTFIGTDITLADNYVTKAAHGFYTGLKVQLTTGTTLPAGLALLTDYFIVRLSASTFGFAASLVNAQAGTLVDITDGGTGTHTVTAVALAGATVKLQKSNDGSNWVDVASAQALTADATYLPDAVDVAFKYVKPVVAITAGMGDLKVLVSGIAEFN